MAKDFRSNQTRTNKIIGSGSNVSGGSPSLLIYSASSATDFDGSYEANMLSSVGSDVFLFVSGAQDGTGKTAFGGDVVISGTLYAETIVVEVEETTTGSLTVSGSLFVSQSATINEGATINASQETGTENNFNVFAGSTRAIFVKADGTDIDITTDSRTTETITITNTQGTANAAIKLDAQAGGVDIDAAAGEDVAIAGGQVAILSKDNVANAITLNTTIGTTETITIQNDLGTSASAIKINSVAGGVDIDAAAGKNVAIDGGQIILTSKDDATNAIELITNIGSSETITIQNIQGTAAEAVQLYANNGGILIKSDATDKKLHMQTDGADADAIHLDAASGGIDIDSGTGIDISTSDLIVTGNIEISAGYKLTSPAFSGSLTHLSDGTSYLVAGSNVTISTGSNGSVTIASTGGGGATSGSFNETVNVSGANTFVTTASFALTGERTGGMQESIEDFGSDTFFFVSGNIGGVPNGSGVAVFGGDVVVSGTVRGGYDADAGFEIIAAVGEQIEISNANGYDNDLIDYGSDTFLFVSGALGSKDSGGSRGTSVFGGDLVVSGATVISAAKNSSTNSFIVYGGSNGSTSAISVSDSATSLNAQGATSRVVLTSLGSGNDAIRINSSGGVDIDADGEKPVNIAGGTVTLETNGDGTIPQQITLNTNVETDDLITIQNQAGTSASAIKINASAGGIDIDAATGIDVNTTDLVITGSVEISANNDLISPAFSGSLTHLSDGTSYLIAGSNITITSASNGAVTIAAPSVLTELSEDTTPELGGQLVTGDHKIAFGTGDNTSEIDFTYNGGGNFTAIASVKSIDMFLDSNGGDSGQKFRIFNNLQPTSAHAGGTNTDANAIFMVCEEGNVFTKGYVTASMGFSGSLTQLTDGTSYLVAGSGISITSGSNGSVTITNDGTVGDITSVTAGTGLSGGGSSGDVTLDIDDSVVATVSGTTFTGDTVHQSITVNEYVTASLYHQLQGEAFQFLGAGASEWGGTDTAFYVSGAQGKGLGQAADVAVFGGDLVVSGGIYGGVSQSGVEEVSIFADHVSIGITEPGTDTFLHVSGAIDGLQSGNGVTVFGGDVTSSGSIQAEEYFIGSLHQQFSGEAFQFLGAGASEITATDVAFYVSGAQGKGLGQAADVAVFGGDLVVSGGLYGGEADFGGTELSLFAESISLGETEPGQDTFLYVSGAEGGKQTGDGVAVFGGDVVFSGTIFNPGMSPDTGGSAVKFGSFNELFYETSDARIKTDINTIDAGLHKVQNLRGVTFRNSQREDSETEVGLIAQEVQAVVPEIVTTTPSGYLQVDYAKMVAVLIEAVKEQQSTIQLLESRILALEEK